MNKAADVQIVQDPAQKSTLAPLLTALSSTTEMSSYGNEQWQYLLDAGNVTPVIVTKEQDATGLLGCVLRVAYGPHAAYGMMLVSPDARGQGLARKLLEAAMKLPGDMKILGTCTEMGRPFYEKIGYERVSTVTRMTAPLEEMQFPESFIKNDVDIKVEDSCSNLDDVLGLDAKATGLDRAATLKALHDYLYVKTATISDNNGELKIAALITQHTDAPFCMVGPIVGDVEYVPTLLTAVAHHTTDVYEVALIVSDHESLVESLQKAGFKTTFKLGAMTLGGTPMPGNRDLYLGLIHPTLG